MCYIYTTEYFSAVKKHAVVKYASKLVKLEPVILNKVFKLSVSSAIETV